MKGKPKARFPGKRGKRKTKWFDLFITTFVIVLLGGFLVGVVIYNHQQQSREYEMHENLRSMPVPGQIIDPKMVCMVNNMYMGIDQIPVLVQNKTYYGCCDKCILDLNNDETVRYAIDPYSKVSVDKALAFITMNPAKRGAILYFESAENARKYLKSD